MPIASTPLTSGCKPLVLPRIRQISEYHCGPAVLQMLLGQRGVAANQERLTELADVAATIKTQGARVDQLARAVAWLRAGVCLWYKNQASAEDLVAVVCRYRCPAGVEWQGFFEDREEDEDWDEGDYGHYSIVTRIDRRSGLIIAPRSLSRFLARGSGLSAGMVHQALVGRQRRARARDRRVAAG